MRPLADAMNNFKQFSAAASSYKQAIQRAPQVPSQQHHQQMQQRGPSSSAMMVQL